MVQGSDIKWIVLAQSIFDMVEGIFIVENLVYDVKKSQEQTYG